MRRAEPGPGPTEALAGQARRWARVDPLLPAPVAPAAEPVEVVPGAWAALVGTAPAPEDPDRLVSADAVLTVAPVLGDDAPAALAALLPAVLAHAARVPGRATVLRWPSRDVAATRALLDAGLVALSVIAVATGLRGVPSPDVRAARPADLDVVHELVLAERAFSVLTGPAVARPGDAELLRTELAGRLAVGGQVWLAPRDGRAVGVLDGGLGYAAPGGELARLLPLGAWGAVHHCGVAEAARGTGVGRALVEHAHAAWAGTRGAALHFHPANPLSSVFWARRGYRPLWTVWEHRPPAR